MSVTTGEVEWWAGGGVGNGTVTGVSGAGLRLGCFFFFSRALGLSSIVHFTSRREYPLCLVQTNRLFASSKSPELCQGINERFRQRSAVRVNTRTSAARSARPPVLRRR